MNIAQLKILADYFNVSLDYLCDRPFNNNVGFIPEERKCVVKEISELNDKDFEFIKGALTILRLQKVSGKQ